MTMTETTHLEWHAISVEDRASAIKWLAEGIIKHDEMLRPGIWIAMREINRDLVEALKPFAEPHAMGDNYVKFAPRLIETARAALAKARGEQP